MHDVLCMYRVRRFHWILLVIKVDKSECLIHDSLDMDKAEWADMRQMIQK